MPPPLLTERWALTPPFHPYLRRVPCEDIPKVFLRAITGIRSAGGIFSVALSVNRSIGFSPCSSSVINRVPIVRSRTITDSSLCYRSPGVTRRVALPCSCSVGLSPSLSTRKVVSGLSSRSAACATEPAIIQLTRHLHYIAQTHVALAFMPGPSWSLPHA
jgi:hypothetical protein